MKKYNMNRSILALAILGLSPLAMAQQSSTTGEFRKDQSEPKIYSQEGLVDNFAQKLPVGATFAPLLTAWDAEDGDLTASLVQVSGVNTWQPGQYVAQYQITDSDLPAVDGFEAWGKSTTTYSLPVSVYDPAIEQPENILPLGVLWQDGNFSSQVAKVAPGQALSRTFWLDGGALPLLGDRIDITAFQIQEGLWGGNNRQFSVVLSDLESGEQIVEVPATYANPRLALATPVSLQTGKGYRFTLRYLSGPDNQGFKLNDDGEFWLQAEGQQTQALHPYAQVLPDPANQLAFDPGLSRPLKEKMLSSKGGNEALYIRKLPGFAQDLIYVIQDPELATLQVQTGTQQDKLVLSGLRAGETNLEIRANGKTVDLVHLVITTPKELTLSYSYIAFPGETKTHLWDDGALIEREISRRYAPYNIQINWVDHGVLIHEWDKDGNGDSYTADRSEQEAPLKEGWIPDADQVFSNLYVMRRYKDDTRVCSGSGSGSSTGMGASDVAPREGHRAACPGNATELGQALTLAHELGHNLGLWHTKDTDPNGSANLMYVGRLEGVFFANQWRTIHETLLARMAAGDQGIREGAGQEPTPPPVVNQPPLANAGGDLSVTGPADAVLDGSASRDPEGQALRYQWRQISGTPVTITDDDQALARVAVPATSQDSDLAFELTVTDEQGAEAKDRVLIHNGAMVIINQAPSVSLPASFTAEAGESLTITAQGSDPDGDALSYQWQVPAGLAVSGIDAASLTITAPEASAEQAYELSVTVTDGALDAQASTHLTVQPKVNSVCATTDPEAAKYPAWKANKAYTGKALVSYDQLVWQAKYWTKGNPPSRTTDYWALISNVVFDWDARVTYLGGDLARYAGHQWQAKYWTLGNEPGKSDAWTDLGASSCN